MASPIFFGKRKDPCSDCSEGYCTMNCGPKIETSPKTQKATALPDGFKVICSACAQPLDAATQFSAGQLKKKHPRCRACAPNKFKNLGDQGGASRKESRHARDLRAQAAAGIIHELREQVPFELIPAQKDPATGRVIERACIYVADFVYFDDRVDRRLHVVDAKGFRTKEYRIKRKLMLSVKGIRIEEV